MFGQKLKSFRKKKGLTQEELAEHLNVSRQAITKWETDKGMPDIDNLKSISLFFNVTIDELINDVPIKTKNDIKSNFILVEFFALFIGMGLWFFSQDALFGLTVTVLLPSIVWVIEKIVLDKHYQKKQNANAQRENLKDFLPKNFYGRLLDIGNTKDIKIKRLNWYCMDAFLTTSIMVLFDNVAQYFGTYSRSVVFSENIFINLFIDFLLLFVMTFIFNIFINERVIIKYNRIK